MDSEDFKMMMVCVMIGVIVAVLFNWDLVAEIVNVFVLKL